MKSTVRGNKIPTGFPESYILLGGWKLEVRREIVDWKKTFILRNGCIPSSPYGFFATKVSLGVPEALLYDEFF